MGIKKIARPINKAKNQFVQWLKDHKAKDIDEYEGATPNLIDKSLDFQYYRSVTGFVGKDFYKAIFTMWQNDIKIHYRYEEKNYRNMSIQEFLTLIN